MSYWEKNHILLDKYFPGLKKILVKGEGDFEGRCVVESGAGGLPTLKAGGMYVHSRHDPVKEAGRLAASIPPGEGPIVLLGFGLGYLAEAAAKTGRPLIVVEKHPSLLRLALEERDLGTLLASKGLIFVVGGTPQGISGPLELFESPPDLIKTRALVELDRPWYEEAEALASALLKHKEVNKATLKKFGRRWVRNLGKNREAIRDLPGITALAGAGRGFPALLAAAGPSLDRIGPLLPALRERCVLIAVDTSLRFLLAHGADPDFTVTVDPQYWNDRHLDRCSSGGSLIAESAVYPRSLRRDFKRRFLSSSLFPLGRFIEDRVESKGPLGAGGSVATSAWDFARHLGCTPIWLAGLDLGFPDGKTHFQGALFEQRALAESGRLSPAETRSVESLLDGRPFYAPAMDGGTIRTDRRLSLYASWFERQFSRHEEIDTYSLAPGGLYIKGLKSGSAEAILKGPPQRKAIDAALDRVFASLETNFFSPKEKTARAARYEKALEALSSELRRIIDLAAAAAKTAKTGWKNASLLGAAQQEALLKRLESVNSSISESQGKEVAGFLFPPLEELEKTLTSPPSNPLRRHLELSWKLYEALAQAAAYSGERLTAV
jgi:hypothetical protein